MHFLNSWSDALIIWTSSTIGFFLWTILAATVEGLLPDEETDNTTEWLVKGRFKSILQATKDFYRGVQWYDALLVILFSPLLFLATVIWVIELIFSSHMRKYRRALWKLLTAKVVRRTLLDKADRKVTLFWIKFSKKDPWRAYKMVGPHIVNCLITLCYGEDAVLYRELIRGAASPLKCGPRSTKRYEEFVSLNYTSWRIALRLVEEKCHRSQKRQVIRFAMALKPTVRYPDPAAHPSPYQIMSLIEQHYRQGLITEKVAQKLTAFVNNMHAEIVRKILEL